MQKQIKFLGHLVSEDRIRVNPEKIKAIIDWPRPTSVKNIRSFLGISGYYRKFIQNYSKVASPLTELLKDEQRFKWGEEQQSAFDFLKQATTSAPILVLPDMSLPFKVTTDACSRAIGAVLSQNNGKGDQPIAYLSKKLSGAEQNWPAHEQELFAVVNALKHWKYYLLGSRFDVYTDSIALKTIMTQQNLSRKQFKWVMELQEFLPFNIIHVSGKKNKVADALSRHAYAMELSNVYEALAIDDDTDEAKEELDELLRDQQATSSSSSSSIGNYLDEDEDSDTLIDRIREAYNADPQATNIRNTQNENYRYDNDLIYYNNRLLVPSDNDIKESIMKMCHDFELSGHLGTAKTAELVKRYFYWNNIDAGVREYVLSCPYCQADKDTNQRKLGLLQSIEIPTRRWQVITVDFITSLPDVTYDNNQYNAICVFVDKYSKMVHLAPCNKNITAPLFARMFMKEIVRLHGIPKRIISDRDTRFNSIFFRKFTEALDIDLAMSTAFHPQTDGQTERVNRILQEMLRHYVYEHHEKWVQHLPYAEFAINNSTSASTGHTPFYLNYGEHPATPLSNMTPNIDDVPEAADSIKKIHEALTDAREKMEAAQRRQAHYANSSRREKTFNEGDQVMLRTANYLSRMRKKAGTLNTSTSLVPRYVGPYPIIRKLSDLVYQLKLPASWGNVHNVFHVSQLQPYRTSTQYRHQQKPPKAGPPVLRQALSGDTVQAIIGRKNFGYTSDDGHQYKYFIKWRDQPDSSNQWVLPDDIKNHNRRHPLLNKFDTQVPFAPDEPEPGSHTQISTIKTQELYQRD